MKATLAVVCFPIISPQDAAWIDTVRTKYPKLRYSDIPPHFTFVFPTHAIDHQKMVWHTQEICQSMRQISFVIRCCITVQDDTAVVRRPYIVLVPDEGFSQIVKLHDRLYTGVLQPDLRLDIPYIPHITLGSTADPQYAKDVIDELNAIPFEIRGTIGALSVLDVSHSHYEVLAQSPLNAET